MHGPQRGPLGAPFEEPAFRTFAQCLHQAVERGLAQAAVGGGALERGHKLAEPGVQFEVSKMADGDDPALRAAIRPEFQDFFHADKIEVRTQLRRGHGRRFDGAGVIFAEAPEIFPGERVDVGGRFFIAEAHGQVFQRDAAVPGVQPVGERAAGAAQPGHPRQRERLQEGDQRAGQAIKQRVHPQRKQILRTQS